MWNGDSLRAAFDVETGLEVRLFYRPDDVQRSQLFRGPLKDEDAATTADTWRLALIGKGFSEIGRLTDGLLS